MPETATPNPVVDHMPYLPAAFLVAVPGVVLERATGFGADPRWVMGLVVVAALVALARRPEPGWARGAAIMAFVVAFLAGGLAAAVALARRVDHVGILPVSSVLVLLGLLIPARTFQPNYLALVAGLLGTGWLVVGAHLGVDGDDELTLASEPETTRVGPDRAP
ncbi:hypothetical protein [Iamia sp.]|uniref:hypothetical protein n=1 Tax=Iamia sp. TaxID=2722710 RepID=UPI002BFFD2B5|nr:hypothetical protein [Iamia sp.]HXH57367.1 hypothetical protein [Iamia sp.]